MQKPSASQVKARYNENNNGHFFDRDTMRFFGDKMSSFSTVIIDDQLYLYRKPTARVCVFDQWKVAGREQFHGIQS